MLNLFNGDGDKNGFPTERGAKNFDAYQRQQAKIVSALVDMTPMCLAMEVENDGYGSDVKFVAR